MQEELREKEDEVRSQVKEEVQGRERQRQDEVEAADAWRFCSALTYLYR